MALQAIPKEEVEKMFREAHAEGRKLEVVPGKLVTVIKPAPEGGKKKARIVACGNFTAKDAQDELYASTGDAVSEDHDEVSLREPVGRSHVGHPYSIPQHTMGRHGCAGEATPPVDQDEVGRRRNIVETHQGAVWLQEKPALVGESQRFHDEEDGSLT